MVLLRKLRNFSVSFLYRLNHTKIWANHPHSQKSNQEVTLSPSQRLNVNSYFNEHMLAVWKIRSWLVQRRQSIMWHVRIVSYKARLTAGGIARVLLVTVPNFHAAPLRLTPHPAPGAEPVTQASAIGGSHFPVHWCSRVTCDLVRDKEMQWHFHCVFWERDSPSKPLT